MDLDESGTGPIRSGPNGEQLIWGFFGKWEHPQGKSIGVWGYLWDLGVI